jgi:hypothetical protein
MVIKVFLLGFLVVLPVMIFQRGLLLWLGDHTLIQVFGISAGVEEFFKWFLLYHIIYNHTEFDEPYDGILYDADEIIATGIRSCDVWRNDGLLHGEGQVFRGLEEQIHVAAVIGASMVLARSIRFDFNEIFA